MTRHPDTYEGAGTRGRRRRRRRQLARRGDGGLRRRLLPGALPRRRRLREQGRPGRAQAFGAAAARAGLQRIVYLGGLGDDSEELSAHLRSRREVETELAASGVPVTTLRAGIIIGDGGISWEMTRQLVDHLPAMITPRWVMTRTQPIAVADVVRYLVGVLDLPEAAGRALEIGGPEVLRYKTMLQRVADLQGRDLPIVPVPVAHPQLSSRWLSLVTDVDTTTGRNLVDSMTNEVVVKDPSIREPRALRADGLRRRRARGAEGTGRRAGRRRTPPARRPPTPSTASSARCPSPSTSRSPMCPEESDAVRTRRRRVVAGVGVGGCHPARASRSASRPGSKKFYWLTGRARRDLDRSGPSPPGRCTWAGSRGATTTCAAPSSRRSSPGC